MRKGSKNHVGVVFFDRAKKFRSTAHIPFQFAESTIYKFSCMFDGIAHKNRWFDHYINDRICYLFTFDTLFTLNQRISFCFASSN